MPAAPATRPPPSRRRGDVRPAGPPAALPDPAALSPTSSAASLAGRPGSKRADTGKFWGREGRALKGPRPLFTGGVGGTEELPKLERNGKNVGPLRSFWLRVPLTLSPTLHLNQEKKSPPVAWGSCGRFPHLLGVLEENVDMYVVQMSKQGLEHQGAPAKCLTSKLLQDDVCVLIREH